ncbi:MAG: helix-turn-helix domain-containing protein [Bdellovibrio sp.]|nr:helix-turn-helix domain-containing protein [Bdellovibrio sp.]
MDIGQILYNIEEAARILNLRISRLRTAVFRKEIGYVKLAGLVRFTKDDLENWIRKNQIQPK